MDQKYMPVEGADVKVNPKASLLVLDITKSVMEASLRVSHAQFATPGQFDQERQRGDAYWKANLLEKTAGKASG